MKSSKEDILRVIQDVIDNAYNNPSHQVHGSLGCMHDREYQIHEHDVERIRASIPEIRDNFMPDKYSTDHVELFTKSIKYFNDDEKDPDKPLGWVVEIILYASLKNGNENI